MRHLILAALIVTLVAATGLTAFAVPHDFAITYVTTMGGETFTSRYYYQGDEKRRAEEEVYSSLIGGGAVTRRTNVGIVRRDLGVRWVLNSEERSCFEAPLQLADPTPEPFFKRFPKVREEKFLGYLCEVYHTDDASPYAGPSTAWYAPDLKLVLRSESGSGDATITREAVKIELEQQPDSLFEIPPDYRKVTLDGLLKREVSLPDIDHALFDSAESVTIVAPIVRKDAMLELNSGQVSRLRSCLLTCTNFGETASRVQPRDVVIVVEGRNHVIRNLAYSVLTGRVSVYKIDINQERNLEYMLHPKLHAKFLEGSYQLTASPEFKAFIEGILKQPPFANPEIEG